MHPTTTRIKDEKCPVCRANFREVRVGDQHCSGEWNERVLFQCGCELHYSPNLSSIETSIKCPNAHKIALELMSKFFPK